MLLADIDGWPVALTEDLLYAVGKVLTMHDLQYNYGAADGVESAIFSLANLERRAPIMRAADVVPVARCAHVRCRRRHAPDAPQSDRLFQPDDGRRNAGR